MTSSLKRSVLITGCSVGSSGHALAIEFANRGMRVFATARSTKSLSQLEAKGIETFALDVTSADSIAALKAEITKQTGGKLDMLFNNAGIMYEAPAVEADIARVRQMFDTNVFGLFDMTQAFLPLLLASVPESRVPPTIINTSSVVSRVPFLFSANYNASKAAVTSYSDTLRLELAPLGIKVVTLFMGKVSTKITSPTNISFGADSLYIDVEAGVRERSRLHTAKSIQPEEFARQVASSIFSTPALGKGEYVWKGTQAILVWFLNAVGFRKIFDGTLKSEVGLEKGAVRKAIYDKGQRSIKRE
ncbi:NAD(P)-binding protein [Cadophora sp. DSE1049]|nr:NAD(P)-binding protein [Cadophora sp. DSE1049]